MRKTTKLLSTITIIFLTSSVSLGSWNNTRDYETVLITGNRFSKFQELPVDQLFIYAYDWLNNEWHQIPYQIDEKDGGNDYFINPNQVLDSNDEILVMAKDAGDRATQTEWIDDEDSRQFNRYEIEIADPLDPTSTKYIYVYRSNLLTREPNLTRYMYYTPASSGGNDKIETIGYVEGHNTSGVPDEWRIPTEAGGNNADILDRQKARVKGKYKLVFFSVNYQMKETDLELDGSIQYKTGPIRTIRDIKYKVNFAGIQTVTVGTFKYQYYPYQIISFGTNKSLSSDYGIQLIRQSFDLNANATGMLFNDPTNFEVLIDGVNETVTKTLLPSPEVNWYMYSGTPGTIIMLNEYESLSGATESFYYRDSESGGTADGTDDTGDNKSYGDAGIRFDGSKIQGSFSIPYATYYLPGNQPREVGFAMKDHYQNPLTTTSISQGYVSPAEIVVSIPDTTGQQQIPIQIPVQIGDLLGEQIDSLKMQIYYNSRILSVDDITTENTLVETWSLPVLDISTDTVKVSLNGTSPLAGSGVLINLNCTPIGEVGDETPLNLVHVKFNRGDPIAIITNGSLSVLPPPEVAVSLPDTSGVTGTDLFVPVKIGDITGMYATSCHIGISYSKFVLRASEVSLENTIASDWNLTSDIGATDVEIQINGNVPLAGSGNLVWIRFSLLGDDNDFSQLHFTDVTFNDGVPVAQASDGSVTISTPPPNEIQVFIPNRYVKSNEGIYVPIVVSSLTGFGINNYRFELSFDGQVLDFTGVDAERTISESSVFPLVDDQTDKAIITAIRQTQLSGSGALVYLKFNVVGPDGSSSIIHFENIDFLTPNIFVSANDGTIFVSGVIPVELASLEGTAVGTEVRLRWTTESETNNYGFFIERRNKVKEIWEEIGFKEGAGTTAHPQTYEFRDKNVPVGDWQYRLKQQDMDGSVHFSHEINVRVTAPEKFTLKQNFPNPFNAATTIPYELPEGNHKISVTVFNLLGQPIRHLVHQQTKQGGFHQVIWDGKDENGNLMPSGVYYVQLITGKTRINRKILFIE